ncbi:putative ATP-dependent RNA helicase ddx5 [Bulinus truncatus]|nr:putative ATP-dependent RNA helicase ddx5 [Bulinus truncatus]
MFKTKLFVLNVCRNHKLLSLIDTNATPLSHIFLRGFAASSYEGLKTTEIKDDDETTHSSSQKQTNVKSAQPLDEQIDANYSKSAHLKYRSSVNFSKSFSENRYSNEGKAFHKRETVELGANIKEKDWNAEVLPPLEKNFYVEKTSSAQNSEIDIDSFYKSNNIIIKRGQKVTPIFDFHDANFPDEINMQLQKNGWTSPTSIQSIGWPLALSGKNMVGIAQTGSGKTLGFVLPALIHIKHQRQVGKGEGPVVLVLAPTRELAQQIKSVASIYGKVLGINSCCIFGGQSKLVQSRHISLGPEIVVATPGRLLDFIETGMINLNRTSYVVLDEADRMLDMGFEPQIRKVLGQIRPDRQILMWSATWPQEIRQLAHDFLGDFVQVNIGSAELMANPNIEQIVKVCQNPDKFNILAEEIKNITSGDDKQKVLIFVQTKSQADLLTHRLRKLRFQALAIHGDKSQLVRDKTLRSFREGETNILVATDVAARGLDVNDITLVVNYDYPNTADDYIHRIGRTARASKTGKALTLITDSDAGKVEDLMKVMIDARQDVPSELANLAYGNSKPKSKSFSKFSYSRSRTDRRNSW